jgi:H+/Cl- antiporter ClcA
MCFDLAFIENLLIWLVVVGCIVALLRLLLPWVLGMFGVGGDILMRAINIVIGAIIAIFVIVIIFDLVSCLLGAGGGPLHLRRP